MIKSFLTDFSSTKTSPRWRSRHKMQTSPPCMYWIACACGCGWPLCMALSARVTAEASKREQNLTGSKWVLSSDDQWPVGNLENPNCVLSEPATAGAIIHSLLNLSPSVCMVLCVHASVPMPVCVWVCVLPLLESPRSLRELWKINTVRQLCLFIHLITHYHCITVPLISHHRAQIDTFVLFYHTGVWCNQLNLHLTPDTCTKWTLNRNTAAPTTQQYEKEESKCAGCLEERGSLCPWPMLDRLTPSRSSVLEEGVVEHANNRGGAERWGPLTTGPPTHQAPAKAPAIEARTNSALKM